MSAPKKPRRVVCICVVVCVRCHHASSHPYDPGAQTRCLICLYALAWDRGHLTHSSTRDHRRTVVAQSTRDKRGYGTIRSGPAVLAHTRGVVMAHPQDILCVVCYNPTHSTHLVELTKCDYELVSHSPRRGTRARACSLCRMLPPRGLRRRRRPVCPPCTRCACR